MIIELQFECLERPMSHGNAEWHPINENHAIEVMGVAISFSQAIPSRVLNRIFQTAEDAAFSAGLRSRHFVQGVEIRTPLQGGSAPTLKDGPVVGRIYNAIRQAQDGIPAESISEQLQLDGNRFVYRTWNYVSWDWLLQRITTLINPALEVSLDVVSVDKIRLEYLDRFFFSGDASSAAIAAALKPSSKFVAPHIYLEPGLCHSHTGSLKLGLNGKPWLMQANLDLLDRPDPTDSNGSKRWLNITTALEQLSNGDDDSMSATEVVGIIDVLHEPLKSVLGEIISDKLARRIALEG